MSQKYNNGIYSPRFESLLRCESLNDLGTRRTRDFISSYVNKSRCFFCGCGGKEEPRKLWCVNRGSVFNPHWIIRRGDIRAHPPWCFLHRSSDGLHRKAGVDAETFVPLTEFLAPTSQDTIQQNGTDYSWGEYSESPFGWFCRASLSTAFFAEMRAREVHQPSAFPLFRTWNQIFDRPTVPTGKSARQLALLHNCSLAVGIIEMPFPWLSGNGGYALEGQWWDEVASQTPQFEARQVSSLASARMEGCTQAFGHRMPPPSAVAALIDRDSHQIRRLWAHAGWTNGRLFIPTASGYESAYAAVLGASGALHVKPLLKNDVARFYRIIEGRDLAHEVRFCPDFVVWNPRTYSLTIIEVRGFRPGEMPEYDKNIDEKKDYFEAWPAPWRFRLVNGWELASVALASAIGEPARWNPKPVVGHLAESWFFNFKASLNSSPLS